MKTLNRLTFSRLASLAGLGLLMFSASGDTCTKEVPASLVVTVDVAVPFHAEGIINHYADTKTIALGDSIDIEQLMADNSIDSIKAITVESAFYNVLIQDPEPTRTVSDNLLQVNGHDLFTINSVLVDDPAIQSPNWGTAPLQAGGVNELNIALASLLAGGNPSLTFTVNGQSSPADVRTDFTWQAKVRFKLVGLRKIKIFEPI